MSAIGVARGGLSRMVDSASMAEVRCRWSPLAALVIAAASVHLYVAARALQPSDFAMIHTTTRALVAGRPGYEPHSRPDGLWWNMNPPQFHLLTVPLAGLSESTAAGVFRVVNLLLLLCAVVLIVDGRELLSRRGGWIIAAALASPALVMQTGAGQVAGILALLASGIYAAIRRDRWEIAGALIGILCAVKPIFLPLLAWLLVTHRWRPLSWACGAGLTIVTVSAAIWGMAPQVEWLRALRSVTWFDSRFNMAWPALAARLRGGAPLSYRAVTLISLVLVVISAVSMRETAPGLALTRLFVLSIVIAPLGWLYYLCVAGPLLIRWVFDGGKWPLIAWLLWVPLPLVQDVDVGYWSRLSLASVYAWGMLGLAVAVCGSRQATGRERNEMTVRHEIKV